ncbi:alpha/beta hydrolase family protein [Paenibacillus sp. y28]|uniref:alpha/beta hydrolase family protein n=1 Tax=Paenibacillus sp. y28 TaxID=3129110 RepID=UPI00301ADECB
MEHHIWIPAGETELAATLHYPTAQAGEGEAGRFPLIVICHGFVGSRVGVDRLFVKAAREFSSQGYMVLRFDFAGCGESHGDYGTGGLTSLIEQTRHVLDYALQKDSVDLARVILLGHSLGGAVALLTAARDKRVKTLALWAPVAHPFSDIVKITTKRVYEEAVSRGGADYLGYTLQPVFFESLTEYQPFQEVKKFSGDVLLVHGTADEIIPVDYTFLYQKVFWMRSEGQCEKEILFQADHTFSAGDSSRLAISKTLDWLNYTHNKKKEWHGWSI